MPWPVAGASVERGKNSYQALKRARSRSTSMFSGGEVATRVAQGPVRQNSRSSALGAAVLRLDVLQVRDVPVDVHGVVVGEVAERPCVAGLEPLEQVVERRGVGAARRVTGGGHEPGADLQVHRHVDLGGELQLHAVQPRAEVVEPADDLVLPAAELVRHEGAREPVVAEGDSSGVSCHARRLVGDGAKR